MDANTFSTTLELLARRRLSGRTRTLLDVIDRLDAHGAGSEALARGPAPVGVRIGSARIKSSFFMREKEGKRHLRRRGFRVADMERIVTRLAGRLGGARDLRRPGSGAPEASRRSTSS